MFGNLFLEVSAGATKLSSIVTPSMVNGVMDEVVGLLPTCVPAMVVFIGIRKGVSFLQGVLRSA